MGWEAIGDASGEEERGECSMDASIMPGAVMLAYIISLSRKLAAAGVTLTVRNGMCLRRTSENGHKMQSL